MTYPPPPPPPPPKSNSAIKIVGAIIAIVIILAIFVVALPMLNTAGNQLNNAANPTPTPNPPNPQVTSTEGRTSTSGLDYVCYVDVSVHNNGGAGNVVVWAKVTQGSNEWTKSTSIYMDTQGSQQVTLTFTGVSFWSLDNIQYSAWASTS